MTWISTKKRAISLIVCLSNYILIWNSVVIIFRFAVLKHLRYMSTSHEFTQIDHTVLQAVVLAGSIKYIITNNRDFSLLQPAVKDFLEKTAVNNVTIIVTRRLNVIDLQEDATEDVNQDGQGSLVMMVLLWHRRPRRRP